MRVESVVIVSQHLMNKRKKKQKEEEEKDKERHDLVVDAVRNVLRDFRLQYQRHQSCSRFAFRLR